MPISFFSRKVSLILGFLIGPLTVGWNFSTYFIGNKKRKQIMHKTFYSGFDDSTAKLIE